MHSLVPDGRDVVEVQGASPAEVIDMARRTGLALYVLGLDNHVGSLVVRDE